MNQNKWSVALCSIYDWHIKNANFNSCFNKHCDSKQADGNRLSSELFIIDDNHDTKHSVYNEMHILSGNMAVVKSSDDVNELCIFSGSDDAIVDESTGNGNNGGYNGGNEMHTLTRNTTVVESNGDDSEMYVLSSDIIANQSTCIDENKSHVLFSDVTVNDSPVNDSSDGHVLTGGMTNESTGQRNELYTLSGNDIHNVKNDNLVITDEIVDGSTGYDKNELHIFSDDKMVDASPGSNHVHNLINEIPILGSVKANAATGAIKNPFYTSSDVTVHRSTGDYFSDPLILTLNERRKDCPHSIMIGHVNVNSLRYKFEYFHEILSKNLLDVLCITETKLDDSFTSNLFHCNGFRCHRKDKNSLSGGIMVWVRSDIPHERLIELEIDSSITDIESIVISFNIKRFKFNMSCVYKKPSVPNTMFIPQLCSMLNRLTDGSFENVIVGDLNVNMSCENNVLDAEICDVYGMTNIINSATCFKSGGGTLIDPVIVSDAIMFCNPFNETCGSSDWHNMVGCSVKVLLPKPQSHTIMYRNYKHFDKTAFMHDLDKLPLLACDTFENVDDQYWAFSKLYSTLLNEHAPLKSKVIRHKKVPYMHSDLMKAIHKRNYYKNAYFKSRGPDSWEVYRQHRNQVTKLRKRAIRDYFMKYCSKSTSPKEFWKCFKPFFTDKKSNASAEIVLKQGNDEFVCDRNKVCEILNDFFVSIADDIGQPVNSNNEDIFTVLKSYDGHSSIKKIKEIHKNPEAFNFKSVDTQQVLKLLNKLNANKSTGFDNIPPKIAKLSTESTANQLCKIVNLAFESNTFPSDMKKCEVSPLYKKKDYMNKENYRPISIISVFSKIMETILAEQITEHMQSLFNERLGAYRKNHGCSQVLICAIDTWKRSLDDDKFVGALLMDLSKAFDSIPHCLLLAKMKCYGFSNDACSFMASYLLERKQCVKIKDCKSSWLSVKRGIPQGSCLGPILFNVFVNDLFCIIDNADIFNYADDNTLSISNNSLELVIELLIKDTKNTMQWFLENYMQANPEKFQIMFMKPQRSKTELPEYVSIENVSIKTSEKVKLLGITIDSNLNFDEHVKTICKKASTQLKILFRFRSFLGLKEKETLYRTFILSNFNFCPVVWNFCSKTAARKIEKIQERALRFLTGCNTLSYIELLQKTGSTTMYINRMKCIAVEVFKCIYNLNPAFMNKMFVVKELDTDMRDPCILIVPRFKKIMYGRKTFSYFGAHLWNLLPSTYKESTDINNFKNMLRKWEGPKCCCSLCCL